MSQSQVRLTAFEMYDGFSVKMTWTDNFINAVFCTASLYILTQKKSTTARHIHSVNISLLPATNTGKNLKLHQNSMYLTLLKCHNINLNIPLVKSRFVIKLYFKKLVLNVHYLQLKGYVVSYLKHVIKCPLPQNSRIAKIFSLDTVLISVFDNKEQIKTDIVSQKAI